MPKLWNETVEEHRRAVHAATLDATAKLVAEKGPLSITMSQIAAETGIGRATLYKYFPDIETILLEWHKRHVAGHLAQLTEVRDRAGDPVQRLEDVLEAFALISREHQGSDVAALLHRGAHVADAEQQLRDFVQGLIARGAGFGDLRDDVAPDELASYCLHALAAASSLASEAAIRRLVAVTMSGLRSQQGSAGQ
jgi:AcrR family transcriptional regulator